MLYKLRDKAELTTNGAKPAIDFTNLITDELLLVWSSAALR